jgi:hypothetical protein
MRAIKMKTLFLIYTLFLVGLVAAPVRAASIDIWRAQIPVLTVRDGAGSIVYVKMQYSRDPESNDPLSISISENLPQGSGDQLRSSFWQAAMVAALERQNPLFGVDIRISVPGLIDGPSAGAAICLALLTAIDGKAFPTNVVITGTILPDGSIGRVGGVPLKLMAAHKAGFTRALVPDNARIEYDEEKAIAVDIKQLSCLLGLQYTPVSSVSDAYARLHNITPPAQRTDDKIDIPDAIERHYKQIYDSYTAGLESLFASYPLELSITNDPMGMVASLIASDQRAGQAASMGYYDLAATYQKTAFAQAVGYVVTGRQMQDAKRIESIDKAFSSLQAPCLDPFQLARDARNAGLSTGGIEFLSDVADGRALSDYIVTLTGVRDQLAATLNATNTPQGKKEIEELQNAFVLVEYSRLLLANTLNEFYSTYVTNAVDADKVAVYPSAYKIAPRAGAEHLFYSTYLAAQSTLMDNIQSACSDAGIDPGEFLSDVMFERPESANAFSTLPGEGHDQLADLGGTEHDYLSAILAQSYIGSISQSAKLLMSLLELDPVVNEDDSISYGRTGLLHQLLRTARRRSLDAVLNCRDKGLPWINAATIFRQADFSRDDPSVDKTDVLEMYWRAYLQANAVMLFIVPDTTQQPAQRQPIAQGVRVVSVSPGCQQSIKALAPGDVIIAMDGTTIRDVDELRSMVASLPKKRQYDIRVNSRTSGKDYVVRAEGGQLLGVTVETVFQPSPEAASK